MPFDSGTLFIYNGFTFPGRTEMLGIESRPNWDTAGRTITYWTHSIKVRTTLIANAGETTDVLMAEARALLLTPGKDLVFNGVGYGDLDINVGTERDVVWGPKPQLLSYTPIGTGACEIIYQLDVAIPECENTGDAVYRRAIMELNFQVTYDLDYAGWCTRRISGYYRIPQTRGQFRRLDETTDDYWQNINPAVPQFFKRTSRTRTLDESKCKATFEFVDEELGRNIFPDGIVAATGSHSIENNDKGFNLWTGTLSAEYEVASDQPIDIAWQAFWLMAGRRINLMQSAKNAPANGIGGPGFVGAQNAGVGVGRQVGGWVGGLGAAGLTALGTGNPWATAAAFFAGQKVGGELGGLADNAAGHPGNVAPAAENSGTFVPLRFRATEPEIYGRPKAKFELSYTITLTLGQILQFSGLWRPISNDWNKWAQSMQKVWSPHGMLGMKFDQNDDVIIDLCLSRRQVRLQAQPPGFGGPGIRQMQAVPQADGCDPERSWLEYRNKVELKTEDSIIEHKPLPKPDNPPVQDPTPSGSLSPTDKLLEPLPSWWNDVEAYPGQKTPIKNYPKSKVQHRTSNGLEVVLSGYALRMCYDIEPPQLVSIGGRKGFQANRADMGEGFQTMVVGNFINPMILATWRLRYIIPTTDQPLDGPLQLA